MMETHESERFVPLKNGHRDDVLSSLRNEKAAESQVFQPRRYEIQKIDTRWTLRGPVHTVHLKDGFKIVFNPRRPGIFVLKRGRNYIRAMHPRQIQILDDYAQMATKPRMKYLHRWLKMLFPILILSGVHPTRFERVFKLDRPTFERFYQPTPI